MMKYIIPIVFVILNGLVIVNCEEPECEFNPLDIVPEEYVPSKEDCPCFHHDSNLTQVDYWLVLQMSIGKRSRMYVCLSF